MFLSVFDVFKIGLGPSSSHTMGPMTAAADFLDLLRASDQASAAAALRVTLHGSLALTGRGHATDRAVALGLLGFRPAKIAMDDAESRLEALRACKRLAPAGLPILAFDPETAIVFDYGPALPGHAERPGDHRAGRDRRRRSCPRPTTRSGAASSSPRREREAGLPPVTEAADLRLWPYPFETAAAMLRMARASGLSIAAMKCANEAVGRPDAEIDAGARAHLGRP